MQQTEKITNYISSIQEKINILNMLQDYSPESTEVTQNIHYIAERFFSDPLCNYYYQSQLIKIVPEKFQKKLISEIDFLKKTKNQTILCQESQGTLNYKNICASAAFAAAMHYLHGGSFKSPSDIYTLMDIAAKRHREFFEENLIEFHELMGKKGYPEIEKARVLRPTTTFLKECVQEEKREFFAKMYQEGIQLEIEKGFIAPLQLLQKTTEENYLYSNSDLPNEVKNQSAAGILTYAGMTFALFFTAEGKPCFFDSHGSEGHGASFQIFDAIEEMNTYLCKRFVETKMKKVAAKEKQQKVMTKSLMESKTLTNYDYNSMGRLQLEEEFLGTYSFTMITLSNEKKQEVLEKGAASLDRMPLYKEYFQAYFEQIATLYKAETQSALSCTWTSYRYSPTM